jgi:hypothetical protein
LAPEADLSAANSADSLSIASALLLVSLKTASSKSDGRLLECRLLASQSVETLIMLPLNVLELLLKLVNACLASAILTVKRSSRLTCKSLAFSPS